MSMPIMRERGVSAEGGGERLQGSQPVAIGGHKGRRCKELDLIPGVWGILQPAAAQLSLSNTGQDCLFVALRKKLLTG